MNCCQKGDKLFNVAFFLTLPGPQGQPPVAEIVCWICNLHVYEMKTSKLSPTIIALDAMATSKTEYMHRINTVGGESLHLLITFWFLFNIFMSKCVPWDLPQDNLLPHFSTDCRHCIRVNKTGASLSPPGVRLQHFKHLKVC